MSLGISLLFRVIAYWQALNKDTVTKGWMGWKGQRNIWYKLDSIFQCDSGCSRTHICP